MKKCPNNPYKKGALTTTQSICKQDYLVRLNGKNIGCTLLHGLVDVACGVNWIAIINCQFCVTVLIKHRKVDVHLRCKEAL